jgi:hypothetical protein
MSEDDETLPDPRTTDDADFLVGDEAFERSR